MKAAAEHLDRHQVNSLQVERASQITHYLNENREAMVRLLADLVRAESPSTAPEAQAVPLTILWEALANLGYTVRLVPGRTSGGYLIAENSAEAANNGHMRQQLLLGHCDTVWPIGSLKTMPLIVEDKIVRGPGVFDMKGGLAQMIFALQAIAAVGAALPFAPVILVNTDEEIGSKESLPAIRRLAKKAKRAFVLEPALGLEGKLKTTRKGVGNYEIIARGRAAHAGLDPEEGVSAVLALSYLVQDLHALNDPQTGVSVNVGRIEGGLRANVVAPECRAEVDMRVPTAQEARRLENIVRELVSPIPGVTLEIAGQFGRPPLESNERNHTLWCKALSASKALGIGLDQGAAGGGSDGNYTSQYTATLDGLGAVGDGAHARHEFIFIDKMIERAALLALLLLTP